MSTSQPYGSLEPTGGRETPEPLFPEVGAATTLFRGLRKRCPRCAVGGLFTSWFHMRALCPRCGLRFEKEEGGFLGAMVLNYSLAIGLWLVAMTIGLILTVPNIPVAPLLAVSVLVLVGVPLWFYPNSKTGWAAVEFLVARSEPDYHAPVKRDPRAAELE